MPADIPDIGPYEKWPGYQRLKTRLEMFLKILHRSPHGHAAMEVVLSRASWNQLHRLGIKNLELVIPTNKEEFEKAGHAVRLAFSPSIEESITFLEELVLQEFQKYALFRVCLWANAGTGNKPLCVYTAQVLNEREIYIQSLTNQRYEIGLDAHGNLFDTILCSDELTRAPNA